jgi:hypothetical protein
VNCHAEANRSLHRHARCGWIHGGTSLSATATSLTGAEAGQESGWVSDALGTHRRRLAEVSAPGEALLATCPAAPYGGGFTTSMGAGWSQLVSRSGPCRAATSVGVHTTGQVWTVTRETSGEFICKGRSFGYGSTIWYSDGRGWSWSGGTSDPRWNKSC